MSSTNSTTWWLVLFVAFAGAAVIAVAAQIRLEIPFGANLIPLTGQSLAVLVVAFGAGQRAGTLAVVLYLAAGALGLGVFAGGASGYEHLLGTTGGYLWGFLLAAFVVGGLADKGWDVSLWDSLVANLTGSLILLTAGFAQLWLLKGEDVAFTNGLHPTLLTGAAIKWLIASFVWTFYHFLNRKR